MIFEKAVAPGVTLKFTLTNSEMEEIYREQEKHYLLDDAYRHFTSLYEYEDDEAQEKFKDQYGFDMADIVDDCSPRYLLEDFVAEYKHIRDCNIPENDTWGNAIQNVMSRIYPNA